MEGLVLRLFRGGSGTKTMSMEDLVPRLCPWKVCYQDYAGKGEVLRLFRGRSGMRLCSGGSATETMQGGSASDYS